MAYSFTLDNTTPADGDLVSQGAGKIRNLTTSLIQRLASVFVNVDADPLVFKGFSQSTGTAALNIVTVAAGLTVTTGGLAVSAGATVVQALNTVGDFTVATTKLTVAAATGNTVIAGTLTVGSTGSFVGNVNVNRVTAAGLLGYYGVSRNGTPLYYVGQDASDRGAILNAAATFANMWWDDSGNFAMRGGLAMTGNFAINTNKFTVTAASGNTVIAGTLAVTGAITATGGVVGALTGNADTATSAATLTTPRTIGGVSFNGSANITVATATGGFTVSGGTLTAAATAFSGDMAIATSKFTVAAATGNTVVAGTLAVTGIVTGTAAINAGAAATFGFTGRSLISSPSDGTITFTNAAGTDFTMWQFGGTTASQPALAKIGAALYCKLADNSNYAKFGCQTLQMLDTSGNFQMTKFPAVSVSTSTTICTFNGAGWAIVKGSSGGNSFSDYISSGDAGITVLSSVVSGASARTYNLVGGTLFLTMASGTYTVNVVAMS